MGDLTDAASQNEVKCPRSTDGLELPFWFAGNGLVYDARPVLTSNYLYNVDETQYPIPSGTYVDKKALLELQIHANDDITFAVEVRMLHGRYQNYSRGAFHDSMCMDVLFSERTATAVNSSFHVILPPPSGVDLPVNMPIYRVAPPAVGWTETRLVNPYQSCDPAVFQNLNPATLGPSCRFIYAEADLQFNHSYTYEWMLALKMAYNDTAGRIVKSGGELPIPFINPETSLIPQYAINSTPFVEGAGNRRMLLQFAANSSANASSSSFATAAVPTVDTVVPDVIELMENAKVEQGSTAFGGGQDPLVAIDYLPFFSSCEGTDSRIYLWQVLNTPYTPDVYNVYPSDGANPTSCQLVDKNATVFISQWNPGVQRKRPRPFVCIAHPPRSFVRPCSSFSTTPSPYCRRAGSRHMRHHIHLLHPGRLHCCGGQSALVRGQ